MRNSTFKILLIVLDLALFVVVVWWLLQPPVVPTSITVQSARCSLTLTEQVRRADLIAAGHIEVVIPGVPGIAQVIVKPDHIYLGQVATPTLIITARDAAETTSVFGAYSQLHLTSQDPPYLFFLRRQIDGTYTTSRCDGTRLLGDGPTSTEMSAVNQSTRR